MLDLLADLLSSFACALADALAKAAHSLAQVFAGAYRPTMRDVFAKAFAATSGALACVSVSVSDAAMPSLVNPTPPSSVRHVQDSLVLVLLILKKINGSSNWRDRNRSRNHREKNKQ